MDWTCKTVAGGTIGLGSPELAGPDSWTGRDGGKGVFTGADGAFSSAPELENSCPAEPSVFAPSGWWRSPVGGAGGIL